MRLVFGVLLADEVVQLFRTHERFRGGGGLLDLRAQHLELREAHVRPRRVRQSVAFGVEREPEERGAVQLGVAALRPRLRALQGVEDAAERLVGLPQQVIPQRLHAGGAGGSQVLVAHHGKSVLRGDEVERRHRLVGRAVIYIRAQPQSAGLVREAEALFGFAEHALDVPDEVAVDALLRVGEGGDFGFEVLLVGGEV